MSDIDGLALSCAAETGDAGKVQKLAAAATASGTVEMMIRSWGGRALRAAAERGQQLAVEQLLAVGSSLDSINSEGQTALHAAANHGHTSLVQLLLSAGVPLEPRELWLHRVADSSTAGSFRGGGPAVAGRRQCDSCRKF